MTANVTAGGVVLCGGMSRRMGRPKAMLPFGDEPMLARVVRRLGEAVGQIVVVAAAGQPLPPLSPAVFGGVSVVYDRREGLGPLEGLAVGLRAMVDRAELVFVTACDAPLLLPALVTRVIELSAGYDVAVPHIDGFDQPLAAVYRTSVLSHVEALLASDCRRPALLFDRVRTRRIAAAELLDVDPTLQSLASANSPAEYRALLQRAGLCGKDTDATPPGP